MSVIKIKAADTLFFRDGRPFTMGEDTTASSLFPPPPSVLYGALRTTFIAEHIGHKTLEKLIVESADLKIESIGLSQNDVTLLPLPCDLVVPKDKNTSAFLLEKIQKPIASSAKTGFLLRNTLEGKMDDGPFYIRKNELVKYLHLKTDKFSCQKLPMLTETKIGIGRGNDTRIAADGMLYRVQLQRLSGEKEDSGIEIIVQFTDLTLDTEGVLQLGGERKVASFTTESEAIISNIAVPELEKPWFKIYLTTPAIFRTGWQPTELLAKHNLEIETAALGKTLNIGGWDVEKREPKPMLQAVPAGSVFYVKSKSGEVGDAQKAAAAIHLQAISDFYVEQGFGIALIGKY